MIKKIALLVVIVLFTAMLIRPFIIVPVKTVEEPPVIEVTKPPVVKVVEKPLHDVDLPDFAAIKDVKRKKREFFNFIRPAVNDENQRLLALRTQVAQMLTQISLEEPLTDDQSQLLSQLVKDYRVNKKGTPFQQLNALMSKVDEIPAALVLVQAANESAWGTSRFARIGLNFFGIWCYSKGCGMVPRSRNEGADHEVQAFQSVELAVKRYLHNINTNSAYDVFRTIRRQLREQDQPLIPEVLATGLLPYSERGADYVVELNDMLRHNRQYLADTRVSNETSTVSP